MTVEAYDANFEPLADDKLTDRKLTGQLLLPVRAGEKAEPQRITLGQLREGVFEARIPVSQGGEHTVRVKDPVTGEMADVSFQVANLSLERRSAVRNVALQTEIAQVTGGHGLRSGDRRAAAGGDSRAAGHGNVDPGAFAVGHVAGVWPGRWAADGRMVVPQDDQPAMSKLSSFT